MHNDVLISCNGSVHNNVVSSPGSFIFVHETEHECFVSPEGPAVLVEPLDQLLLALPVHDDHDGPAARLQKSHYPVVSLGPQLVDLQLRHFTSNVFWTFSSSILNKQLMT